MARWGISEEDVKNGRNLLNHPGWSPFVEEYLERADGYRQRAFKLLSHLDKSARYSPAAMASFYQSIMTKITKRKGDVFTERIQLTKTEKILLAAYVYVSTVSLVSEREAIVQTRVAMRNKNEGRRIN